MNVLWLFALLLPGPPDAAPPPSPRPLVAAHYFFWYRWPDEHFFDDPKRTRDLLRHHFPDAEAVDWGDPAWHERQLEDASYAGIDALLPVWWGAPGAYDKPDLRFSRHGLPALVEAWRRLRRRGAAAPAIGMFYDTSTLLNDVRGVEPRGGKADLTTPEGKRLFADTVLDFFALVPKEAWARLDGRPLVVLYASAFAARWDRTLGDALSEAFAERFDGERPFLVADVSWGDIGQDLTCAWGAALEGPHVVGDVVQIGPGYDDTPVPGRGTPIRDREDGAFYAFGWQAVLRARPRLVLVETWNELHEGTGICETREFGRRYLDLTRRWVARLRRGADPGPPIALRRPDPIPRPDLSWGEDAAGAAALLADFARPERSLGLRPVAVGDGPFLLAQDRLSTRGLAPGGISYLYFQASDHWRFDDPVDLVLVVDQLSGPDFRVEYDGPDRDAPVNGAYSDAGPPTAVEPLAGGGRRITFPLPGARLGNRENGGADFRFAIRDRDASFARVELRKR